MERGQARLFSFLSLFAAISVQLEPARKEREDEDIMRRGKWGHQRVREGIRWSSVVGITGGRGWNLTQQRWHAPPLPSSFIHLFQWECEKETAFFIAFLIKYFLLLPMCDTILMTRALLCWWGSGLRQCSTWPLRRKPLEKKLVRSPLGAVASGKHWGPVGSQWGWTCLSRVTSDPCPQ